MHVGGRHNVWRNMEAEVVVDLEFVEMSEDVGVDEVEAIDETRNDDHQLEVLVVRLVEVVNACVRIARITFQLRFATTDAEEIFILESPHLGVVVVDEPTHPGESAIDDGYLPCLAIVDLSGSGKE